MSSLTYAPIVVFAYRRLGHLAQTIESLQRNRESEASDLYVFCDAAKRLEDQQDVDAVRRYVDTIHGFASIRRVYRQTNMGLAKSVIAGVTEVLSAHESVIVLEDDLVVSPYLLRYLNDGLRCYAGDEQVASIHGYAYPIESDVPETFFLRGADCWGWATWRRAWQHFDPDGKQLLNELRRRRLTPAFDLDRAYPYTRMLEDQIAGRNDSWAVRWHASCFLRNMLTLHPSRSLVVNIGNDDSGTHSGATGDYDVAMTATAVSVDRIEPIESLGATRALAAFFKRKRNVLRRIGHRLKGVLGN